MRELKGRRLGFIGIDTPDPIIAAVSGEPLFVPHTLQRMAVDDDKAKGILEALRNERTLAVAAGKIDEWKKVGYAVIDMLAGDVTRHRRAI